MDGQEKDKNLFVHADEKIERIRSEVTELIKTDLNLGHKMDMLMTEQRLLKERVEEGVSKTAYKTYEMVNQIYTALNTMTGDNKIRDHRLSHTEKLVEWIVRGLIIVIAAGAIVAVFRWKL